MQHSFIYVPTDDVESPLDIKHQGNFSALSYTVIFLRLLTTPYVTNEAVCNVKSRSGPSLYVFSARVIVRRKLLEMIFLISAASLIGP